MKAFWKNNPALRIVLMIVLFVLSIALVVAGWKMTGQLAGLGIMLVGVALLLAVLAPPTIDPLRFKERQKESFPWMK